MDLSTWLEVSPNLFGYIFCFRSIPVGFQTFHGLPMIHPNFIIPTIHKGWVTYDPRAAASAAGRSFATWPVKSTTWLLGLDWTAHTGTARPGDIAKARGFLGAVAIFWGICFFFSRLEKSDVPWKAIPQKAGSSGDFSRCFSSSYQWQGIMDHDLRDEARPIWDDPNSSSRVFFFFATSPSCA